MYTHIKKNDYTSNISFLVKSQVLLLVNVQVFHKEIRYYFILSACSCLLPSFLGNFSSDHFQPSRTLARTLAQTFCQNSLQLQCHNVKKSPSVPWFFCQLLAYTCLFLFFLV